MAAFPENQYNTLQARYNRIVTFFSDLETQLGNIGAPYSAHLEIYWDGGKVRRISDDVQISTLTHMDQLKYYNHGLGLMKLAFNNSLFA